MEDLIISLFESFFNNLSQIDSGLSSIGGAGAEATILGTVNNIALAIKPVGYAFLSLFVLLEFAQLSERVGNVTGFMGAGLVIEVLIKLVLCKIVVDNSTEICEFLFNVGNDIVDKIGNVQVTTIDFEQFKENIRSAFPAWWDILGQLAFFVVSALFIFLSMIAVQFVKVVYGARYIEMYVYTAISPIPLSTCLSKNFNSAPNFIKNLFAVCLQGGLLLLVTKIFNVIFVQQINGLGTLATGDWGKIWAMLLTILFNSLLLLICSFQTQKWAKSICHAM